MPTQLADLVSVSEFGWRDATSRLGGVQTHPSQTIVTMSKQLRLPFKYTASAGEFVVNKVNAGCDTTYEYGKKGMDGVWKK